MNTNDYLNIIYTGIVENSKYLNGYIEREQKKAEKEFVKADEFFNLLTDAINNIKNQFHNKHNINLNNYYRWMNRDQEALEDQKYHYPKDIPEIYSIGLPLLHLTAGRYTGHLYLKQVEDFEKKLLEVKNNSVMISVSMVNRNGEDFDLTKYDLVTNNVTPYFPEPKLIGNEFCVYEGAIGNNRFQYFKISKKSNAGKYCKNFIEKYFKKYEPRHEYYNDANKLIEACLIDAFEKINGLDAYLKYWNDCFTKTEKVNQNIYSIQHFEALKEWYNLTFEKYIQENENKYLNEDVKQADVKRWKEEKINEVGGYLKQSARQDGRKHSAISSIQASQLIKFYQWMIGDQKKHGEYRNFESNENKPTLIAYAIMHVYLDMFNGQAVTQQNKDELAKKYGYTSGLKLRNEFVKYKDEDKRVNLNTENKKAAKEHLERFKMILPKLKEENSEAFQKANEDFKELEKKYNKHY